MYSRFMLRSPFVFYFSVLIYERWPRRNFSFSRCGLQKLYSGSLVSRQAVELYPNGSFCLLFAGVKKARFWMPFLLFWACLFQDALALLERFRSWYSGRHQPDASARGREEEPSLTRRVDARRHINLESALILSALGPVF